MGFIPWAVMMNQNLMQKLNLPERKTLARLGMKNEKVDYARKSIATLF